MVTDDFLNVTTDFSLLSLRDLLAARELFHLHLINKPNVVATAVGRYRIRKHPQNGAPGESEAAHPKRTLANSESPSRFVACHPRFRRQMGADRGVRLTPRTLFRLLSICLPAKVPICVVVAERRRFAPKNEGHFQLSAERAWRRLSGVCDVQGREHVASVACLVTDGHSTYALTNRHVAGESGIADLRDVGATRFGSASWKRQLGRGCSLIYPSWPGDKVFVDLDVGLIDVDDLNRWTTQVYGVARSAPCRPRAIPTYRSD